MKIIISNQALKTAFKKIKDIVPKKPTLPILENVVFTVSGNTLVIRATDLQVTVLMELPIESSEKSFVTLVPFAWLHAISSIHNDEPLVLEFSKKGKKLTIIGENDVFEHDGLEDIDTYPTLGDLPNENRVQLNSEFIHVLTHALATCSDDELRPAMTMVNMEVNGKITVTSTNAHCLFTYSFENESQDQNTEALFPAKVVRAISGFKDLTFHWDEKIYMLECGSMKVIALRSEEKYPNWRVVIPSLESNVTLYRSELVHAMEKMSLVNEKHCEIKLSAEGIKLNAEDIDYGQTVAVDVTSVVPYSGEETTIAFAPATMKKLLSQISYSEIDFAFHPGNKAILMRNKEDEAYLGLLMPLTTNA